MAVRFNSNIVLDVERLEEADSVCDSNEPDDLASISVNYFIFKKINFFLQIRRQSSSASTDSGRGADTVSHITSTNTSMRREHLTGGSRYGSQRSLWCELPQVISSGLLELLNDQSKKLQEGKIFYKLNKKNFFLAYFEVITSEISYLRSINFLISHFMAASELMGSKSAKSLITNGERKRLFSNIQAIRDCSEKLLCDLENRFKENLVLNDICDILCEHFEKNFDVIF